MSCGRKLGPFDCCSVVEGDCLELMKLLPDKCVDVAITDPPYGDKACRVHDNHNLSRGKLAHVRDYGAQEWAGRAATREQIDEVRRVSRTQVIFGGNYFELPPTSCWLVWDKKNGDNDFADCELAWTNMARAVRKIEWAWNGMIRQGDDIRVHPTQKPEGVMLWVIGQVGDADTILDPFAGSGTTGVAAAKMGRHFLLMEISPDYCEIARKRIALVEAQPNLFQPKPEQMTL